MKIKNVGIMSPGIMGQAIARQLQRGGFGIYAALDQRSPRTKALAIEAGITDVGNIAALTDCCDVILSIMNPGNALEFGSAVADALKTTRRSPLIVDCNAIAPQTMRAIHERITAAGGRCADAGILSAPPSETIKGRLYVSGPEAHWLQQLALPQLEIHLMSENIGDASALKICDAVMAKGVTAMLLQMLIVAQRLGIADALDKQCKGPRRYFYDWIINTLPVMPPKAYRWVPEVEQIAQTFESVGVSGDMMRAAIDVYEQVAQTALGNEAPEGRDVNRRGKDVAQMLAEAMQR